MTGRTVIVAALAAVVVAVVALVQLTRTSVPASREEIAAAIRDSRPECRSLLKERLRASIVRNGAISVRQVDTLAHMECTVAGPQYEAAGG